MKHYNYFKLISLLSYCFIMIQGSMISIPLIIVLFGYLFENSFINIIISTFAFLALVSSVIISIKRVQLFYLELLIFLLLISPLSYMFYHFNSSFFNSAFLIVPILSFIIFYSLYLSKYTIAKKASQ
jgi:hypothetical protein